jgi:hypothetical protein
MSAPSPMRVLLVNSATAREALGLGRRKFQETAREDPNFPRPWPHSAPNKPLWRVDDLERYAACADPTVVGQQRAMARAGALQCPVLSGKGVAEPRMDSNVDAISVRDAPASDRQP